MLSALLHTHVTLIMKTRLSGLGFSTQKVKGADAVNGFEIGFKPGIAIKLNDKFSVLAKCGFLGYRDDYMNAGSGYGFNLKSEDLSFGFHYEF